MLGWGFGWALWEVAPAPAAHIPRTKPQEQSHSETFGGPDRRTPASNLCIVSCLEPLPSDSSFLPLPLGFNFSVGGGSLPGWRQSWVTSGLMSGPESELACPCKKR